MGKKCITYKRDIRCRTAHHFGGEPGCFTREETSKAEMLKPLYARPAYFTLWETESTLRNTQQLKYKSSIHLKPVNYLDQESSVHLGVIHIAKNISRDREKYGAKTVHISSREENSFTREETSKAEIILMEKQEKSIREGKIHSNSSGTLSVIYNLKCTQENMYTAWTEINL